MYKIQTINMERPTTKRRNYPEHMLEPRSRPAPKKVLHSAWLIVIFRTLNENFLTHDNKGLQTINLAFVTPRNFHMLKDNIR